MREGLTMNAQDKDSAAALAACRQALTEALEHQRATAEVLRVIARAPTDLQQVLDTILATAHRLVDVNNGGLFLYDGDVLQAAAGVDAESFAQLQAHFGQTPMRPQ